VAPFEKAMLVACRQAEGRQGPQTSRDGGKVEDRKRFGELERCKAAVELAKALARKRKQKPSLRAISAALAEAGHLNEHGKPFAAKSIASMISG
jgi:hypothetical protein